MLLAYAEPTKPTLILIGYSYPMFQSSAQALAQPSWGLSWLYFHLIQPPTHPTTHPTYQKSSFQA